MKVLVLYTLPPRDPGPERSLEEFDLTRAAEGIASVLDGAELAAVQGEAREVLDVLHARRPDVVFNLCEAPLGRPDLEPHVAALLEWSRVRFTGSGSQTLALCRRKDLTKAVLAAAGVPVPRAGGYPCIVKPVDEDGSAGIDQDSVCRRCCRGREGTGQAGRAGRGRSVSSRNWSMLSRCGVGPTPRT